MFIKNLLRTLVLKAMLKLKVVFFNKILISLNLAICLSFEAFFSINFDFFNKSNSLLTLIEKANRFLLFLTSTFLKKTLEFCTSNNNSTLF